MTTPATPIAPIALHTESSLVDDAIRTLAEWAVVGVPLTLEQARRAVRQARFLTAPALRDGDDHDYLAVQVAAETLSLFFGVPL